MYYVNPWWNHQFLLYESYNNIGCDDDDEEEEDSDDDMEYTKDAIYWRYDFRIFKILI